MWLVAHFHFSSTWSCRYSIKFSNFSPNSYFFWSTEGQGCERMMDQLSIVCATKGGMSSLIILIVSMPSWLAVSRFETLKFSLLPPPSSLNCDSRTKLCPGDGRPPCLKCSGEPAQPPFSSSLSPQGQMESEFESELEYKLEQFWVDTTASTTAATTTTTTCTDTLLLLLPLLIIRPLYHHDYFNDYFHH